MRKPRIISRVRETVVEPMRRVMELQLTREQPKEENRIRVIASTENPVHWYGWTEILLHGENNVDRSAAATVLFNHNRNMPIGGIVEMKLEGRQLIAELEIDPEARAESGVSILKQIRSKALRGVSIGYHYSESDCKVVTEDDRTTVTVNKWQLREISITPTQADTAAQVLRSLPEHLKTRTVKAAKESAMKMSEQEKQRFRTAALAAGLSLAWITSILGRDVTYTEALDEMALELGKRQAPAAAAPAAPAAPAAAGQVDELAQARAENERLKLANIRSEVNLFARSHGVELSEEDLAKVRSLEQGKVLVYERKAETEANRQNPKGSVALDVVNDARDKFREAAVDSCLLKCGQRQDKDLGLRGASILDLIRRFAAICGLPAHEMNKRELAYWAIGTKGTVDHIRNANVTSGMFITYVLKNVMDKAVMNAFNNFDAVTYPIWTKQRQVSDFKEFTGAALDTGNFVETVENLPFPELTKDEDGYNGSLGLWGVTLSLTFQAIVNDDLGQFMDLMGRAGAIARRTIDKQVYKKVNDATWTNKTTITGALAAGTIDKGRADFATRTGKAGEIIGNEARYLLVPSCLREAALKQTIAVQGQTAFNANTDLQTVVTPHLTQDATPANSKHYLAADPRVADTLILAFLEGMLSPIIEEYDAGAVAARKWKLMLPFVAVLPTGLWGMHQCTAS